PVANINKTELEQVIHNLLRNALDALNQSEQMNKRITIETRAEPNESIIRVSDNGPGLSDDTLSQLFQPFFTTKSDGMGLGLSLCQRIIQRASGVLTAANNEGAAFTIKLPRTEAVGQSIMTMDEVVAVSDRYIDQ
ncbi:ATP-binding protein, partial [Escherichia coli]|nr:ATP-binding protein [Escherichia coli]